MTSAALAVPAILLGWKSCTSAVAANGADAPQPPAPLPSFSAGGELGRLVTVFDAALPSETARDLLAAGSDAVYLARARDSAIVAVPKGGGPPRILATLERPPLAMTFAAGSLWIASGGPAASRGALERLTPRDATVTVLANDVSMPVAIASDGTWVFFVDVDASQAGLVPRSSVVRIPARGGPPTVLASSAGPVDSLALDGDSLYWCDRIEGTVLSVPKTGGEPHPLATERGLPERLVASGGVLYWVERTSESLYAMAVTGGRPRRVAQDFAGFANLGVNGRGPYWTNEAAVAGGFRVLVSGASREGEELPASDAVPSIDALATDGSDLYWERGGLVSRVTPPHD